MKRLRLLEMEGGATLWASAVALHVAPPVNCADSDWTPQDIPDDLLRVEMQQLVEQGAVYQDGQEWIAQWDAVADVLDEGLGGVLEAIGDPVPFLLRIEGSTAIATSGFRFDCTWQANGLTVPAERYGMFLAVPGSGRTFRLDTSLLRLLQISDAFNALPSEDRSPEKQFDSLRSVQLLADGANAYLSEVLAGSRVLVPDQVGLEIEVDSEGRVTFVPTCDGVEPAMLRERFLRTKGRTSIYSLRESDGTTTRIIFGPRQLDVLDRMMKVRKVSGEQAILARSRPEAMFEGLLDVLDLAFWERVIGIGQFSATSTPKAAADPSGFLDSPAKDPADEAQHNEPHEVPRAGGEGASDGPPVRDTRSGSYLIVKTNEDEPFVPTHQEGVPGEGLVSSSKVPAALSGVLKRHQVAAVAWLERSWRSRRRGVILADDMGLGKTLEILVHMARVIEETALGQQSDGEEGTLRWRPILIVVPLILLENETWQRDMRKFFATDGDLFTPIHVLHGKGIDAARSSAGKDISIGRPALAASFLMSHRVVVTNYETVVNYQISLAQLVDGKPIWSGIVTDEAQEFKDPKTRISHALKALNADFIIASTGTPVENRLLDLWNIADTVQPGLLGTAKEFRDRFEQTSGTPAHAAAVTELREKLRYGRPDAFVLRRTKEDILQDLPRKQVRRLRCQMSPDEVAIHESLTLGLRNLSGKGHHLRVLQQLVRLYQHPLGEAIRTASHKELLATSSKLRVVLDELRRIQAAGEKALIFARLHDVQAMLSRVIENELGVRVPIINGGTSSGKGRTGSSITADRAKRSRQAILTGFQETSGFAVAILSPFVAGTGLTITAANHVFHYGRWWNPAVEAQATDRAHRIGQALPVTVYLPIAHYPDGDAARSFDELLDALLVRKSQLADFLFPVGDEDNLAGELLDDLRAGGEVLKSAPSHGLTINDLRTLSPLDFEVLLGCLYRADGYDVRLTPQSGDGGADVIAIKGQDLVLVQAKFSHVQHPVDEAALMDLVAAADHFGNIGRLKVTRLVLATNSVLTGGTRATASRDGIAVVEPATLTEWLQRTKVSRADIVVGNDMRLSSLKDVERWLLTR